jgi:hypothetical protein
MITFQKDNYLVHYNSDGSGDAIFIIQKSPGSRDVDLEIKLPCEVIIGFVAELVRNERVAEFESLGARQLLGLRQLPESKPWTPEGYKHCTVCGELQFNSAHGLTCNNGHGGADSK